jgi:8-oxo-dGTP pyrophosphatase MutT (NUDIX family)
MAMDASVRNTRGLHRNDLRLKVRPGRSARIVRLSQLCKMSKCEQAAAVCYRIRGGAIELLLVQTRGSGRWTFPKGSAEAGLTHAQAAAIEAFEEAGVHGRIEEAGFARYVCRKGRDSRRSEAQAFSVSAHLCEVLRLCRPKESNRNRTWFSVREAKQRLREGRGREDGAEFARVVDKAAKCIQNLFSDGNISQSREQDVPVGDEWNHVQLEARRENPAWTENPPTLQGTRELAPVQRLAVLPVNVAEETELYVLPFGRSRQLNRSPKLLSGAKKLKALGWNQNSITITVLCSWAARRLLPCICALPRVRQRYRRWFGWLAGTRQSRVRAGR